MHEYQEAMPYIFGTLISAYRSDRPAGENRDNHWALMDYMAEAGRRYKEVRGQWEGEEELSIAVHQEDMDLEDACRWGAAFKQEAIVHGGVLHGLTEGAVEADCYRLRIGDDEDGNHSTLQLDDGREVTFAFDF